MTGESLEQEQVRAGCLCTCMCLWLGAVRPLHATPKAGDLALGILHDMHCRKAAVVHLDSDYLVVSKPADLPCMRHESNSLEVKQWELGGEGSNHHHHHQ